MIAFADFYEQRAPNEYQIFAWDSQLNNRTVLRPNIKRFDYMPDEIKMIQEENLILLGTPEHRFLNQKEKCIKILSLETGQQIVPDINRHGLTHIHDSLSNNKTVLNHDRTNLSHIQPYSPTNILALGDSDGSQHGSILRIDHRNSKIGDLKDLKYPFNSLSQNEVDQNQIAIGYTNSKVDIFDTRSIEKPGKVRPIEWESSDDIFNFPMCQLILNSQIKLRGRLNKTNGMIPKSNINNQSEW